MTNLECKIKDVGHDLNNSLSIILGHARVLQKTIQKDQTVPMQEIAGKLESMERAARHCAELVKKLTNP